MPDGEFFPPVQYQPWWGLLGLLILALVVAWWVFVFASTRASRVPPPSTSSPSRGPSTATIRKRYLELIEETRAAYANGDVHERDVYHQLSILLRTYVEEREGTRTVTLTLRELRTTEFVPLSDAVARLYPGAFSPDYTGTVAKAIDEARAVVTSWR
ncbi:MAG: hypothetical protein KF761_00745 [Salinibacterium sp.]|nr:hypothetical protein [Salinibacterium sp.]